MNKNNFDIQKIIEVLENKRNEAIKEYEKQSSILKTTDERQDVIDEIRKIFENGDCQKDPVSIQVQIGESSEDRYAICPICNKSLGLYVGGVSDYNDMNFCCHCGQPLCWEK